MKKVIALILVFALMAVGFAACGSKDDQSGSGATAGTDAGSNTNTGDTNTEKNLSGVVNTDGSTSMEKVVLALSESFMGTNKDVQVNYSGTGSGTGIQSVIDGTCDIGLSSRELKDEEVANGAVAHIVALDCVAVLVNPANPVADLTVEQIAKIFTGEISNWSELGGSDSPIAIIGREAGSGTRGAFEEIVGVVDECAYTNELTSTGDVIANVASNPNAIGYASLSAVDDSVSAVKVGGVECTEDAVKDGSYAIQRPFVMVTKEGVELSAEAQAFLDYAMSAEAAEIIAIAGAVAP